MGLGGELGEASPTATFSFEPGDEDGFVVLVHNSGDSVAADDLEVLVNGSTNDEWNWEEAPDEISPGEHTTIDLSDDDDVTGETVDLALRHQPSDSVLAQQTIEVPG